MNTPEPNHGPEDTAAETGDTPSSAAGDAIPQRDIGLALSGGGIRAAIFHLGMLRYLTEKGLLDNIRFVSTVSGASLLAGLIFQYNDYRWPTNKGFASLHERLTAVFLGKNLELHYILRVLLPWHWPHFAYRGGALAAAIRSVWGVTEPLSKLPEVPTWAIDATTMETGKRWRFRRNQLSRTDPVQFLMGDSTVGYTVAEEFPLAKAMATSAAFPGGISPLLIPTRGKTWRLPDYDHPDHPPIPVAPRFAYYHLADGGVYDNLGLESLFDASTAAIRTSSGCRYLVVSDAGMPFQTKAWGWLSQLIGFSERTVDIMDSQVRNLRVRGLVGSFVRKESAGLMLRISESAEEAKKSAEEDHNSRANRINLKDYLSPAEVKRAAYYPTTLWRPKKADFELIEEHGYQVAKVQDILWGTYTPTRS